jgi:hypothetical protein
MSGPGCNCMECRIRHAIHGGTPQEAFNVDVKEVVLALGEVTAEMLAHVSTKTAKAFASDLLIARKHWQEHPSVAIQRTKGNA